MAASLISRAADVARRIGGALSTTALALSPDGAARYNATSAPTITAGAGVPTEASPDGSIYTRTDGTGGASFYTRIAGAWVARSGA